MIQVSILNSKSVLRPSVTGMNHGCTSHILIQCHVNNVMGKLYLCEGPCLTIWVALCAYFCQSTSNLSTVLFITIASQSTSQNLGVQGFFR